MAGRTRDPSRAREMRALLSELDESGLTVNAFARDRGIAVSRLWYWRKRFRDAARETSRAPLVPVTLVSTPSTGSPFIVEVSGRRVHVPWDFDADVLSRLVSTLEAC